MSSGGLRWLGRTHALVFTVIPVLLALASADSAVVADAPEIWTVQTLDPKGDTRNAPGPDAALLSFRYDRTNDMLWFRIAVYGAPDAESFGVQIAIDTGSDDSAKASWWGSNKTFRFDRLVTARVTRSEGAYRGTMGVTDAAGATAGDFTGVSRNTLVLRVDRDAFVLGVKRTEVTSGTKMDVIAAIGSEPEWTDEIPNARYVTLDLAASRPGRGLREIDVNRNNFQIPPELECRTDDAPSIVRRGPAAGRPLILVPGVFSGPKAFEAFITRHETEYTFFIVTPPGLNGTCARRMPPETASYGLRPWTRRLESDILDLIRRERLMRPVVVSHGYPGSLAVTAIAADHPDATAGVIEIAAMPVQTMPSMSDPTGKTAAPPEERVRYQDELWAPKWFKYVTEETWESNNYPASMFENDPDRAEQVRQQMERTPLPVKIRYLLESNATDDSADIARISVPLLALRPGFSASVLSNSANAWLRTSFVDAWDAFSRNAKIQLKTIQDAGVLVFEDQLKAADDAIVTFLGQILPPAPASRARDDSFDSGGVRIRYVDQGEGPPVVLIHGYAGSLERHWIAPGVFADLVKDHRVIALDCRGHGQSGKPKDPRAYGAEMGQDVIRLLDHLQIRRAHIVGYSMGAIIVGQLLTTNPDRFLTATFVGDHAKRSWTASAEKEAEAAALELESDNPFRSLFLGIAPRDAPPPSDDEIRRLSQGLIATNDVAALAALHRGRASLVVSPAALAAVRVPTLEIIGSEDPHLSDLADLKRTMPSLRTIVIDRATHGGESGVLRRAELLTGLRAFIGETRQPEWSKQEKWHASTRIDRMMRCAVESSTP